MKVSRIIGRTKSFLGRIGNRLGGGSKLIPQRQVTGKAGALPTILKRVAVVGLKVCMYALLLVFLLVVSLYLPPVQHWAKGRLCSYLHNQTSLDVSIGEVSLTFPLDLAADEMLAKDGRDTVVWAQQLQLDVRLLPLLSGRVELNGFELRGAVVNTKSFISDTQIKGRFRLLAIRRPAVCNLKKKRVDVRRLRLKDADISVFLSDTAAVDTTPSAPVEWVICLDKADVERTKFFVRLPGDSMRLVGNLGYLYARHTRVDLLRGAYSAASLDLAATEMSYDIPYLKAAKGFDINHIHLPELAVKLNKFSYNSSGLDLDLRRLALKEKGGTVVDKLCGVIHYDSTRVSVGNGRLQTPYSDINIEADIPFGALENSGGGSMRVKAGGSLALKDIKPFIGDALGGINGQILTEPVLVNLLAEGSMRHLTVDYCRLTLPNQIEVRVNGEAGRLLSEKGRNGRFHYEISLNNAQAIRSVLPQNLLSAIRIPNGLRLGGDVRFSGSNLNLNRNALYLHGGSLRFTGSFNPSTMAYSGQIESRAFPLQELIPSEGLAPLTADIKISGRGTDFLHPDTRLNLNARIGSFAYSGIPMDNISVTANLDGNNAGGSLAADNSWLNGTLNFTAARSGHEINGALKGEVQDLCLGLGSAPKDSADQLSNTHLMASIDLRGFWDDRGKMAVGGQMNGFNVVTADMGYPCGDITFMLGTSPDSTHIALHSGDMRLLARSTGPLERITNGLSNFADDFVSHLMAANLNQDTLKALLPDLHLHLQAGGSNPLQQLMAYKGYEFDSIYGDISTSAQKGIEADIDITNFHTGAVLLEKSELRAYQDSAGIHILSSISNTQKKNPNRFTATLEGSVLKDGFRVMTRFVDEKGKVGMNIGTRATLDGHGGASFTLLPEVSTIAYRQFKVNKDNFLAIDSLGFFNADINLLADDKTHIMLFSVKNDSVNQDITLSLNNLNLHDLSSVLPYMPSLSGMLQGDVHVQRTPETITAVGQLQTRGLEYDGIRIGDIGTELFYMPEEGGQYVVAQISASERQVASLEGHYWERDGGTLEATATLEKFPVSLLNTFLPSDGTVALNGQANGEISVQGPTSRLVLNGTLKPDSIHAYSDLYGFDLRMEDKDIPIRNSRIRLDDVCFYSIGDNPLHVNGAIDLNSTSSETVDLTIKAKDFQLVKAEKTKKTVLFGDVRVDIDAALKSHREFMVLSGNLNVLGKTDFTYIMRDTPLQVDDQFSGLVEFVDFSASQDEEQTEAPAGGLVVNLGINIDELTHLHCLLSEDGKSYVDCNGGGKLTFRMFPSGDMSMQGRYNIQSGEMKYTLPFIPLKTFRFTDGNYVQFNGDVSNPTLNITAMESTKAAVSDDSGASRMVKFNVGVAITRTLQNMGIQFLIEAPEDQEVESELSSMTAENKSRVAVSLLATGLYLSSTNKTGFKANNALNAFLESEIQNIAGSALKTIDISAGVEGNTTSTGDTQTDYTFQFSKKLWGDRVTFIIGGKVTTGATDDNSSSQSFIDNVSLQYRLDKVGTRYIQLFYDNDTHDPLEGSYSSAGAGYILRRKMDSLTELFLWRKNKNK